MLLDKLDKSGNGLVDYNDYMYYVIPYLRSRYSRYSQLSKEKITDYFMKLDSNGDGYLSPFEFKHLVSASTNWEGSKLTNDEVDAVVEVLDVVS